jgi:hypothetical protein
MRLLTGEIVAMAVFAIAILLAGCTAGDTPAPVTGSVPAAAPAVTPITAGTVSTLPITPGCAYPPLNPWTWVPESYPPTDPDRTKLQPAPGTLVSKADLFGTPSLQWDEYEYSQQIRGLPDSFGTSRMEKSKEDSRGKPVIHENHTYGLHPEESRALWDTTMDDMYYDEYGNMVSMHRRVIRDGEFLENRDYPPVTLNRGTPDCSGTIFEPRYTFTGIDPVTVPAGTYPGAMKYVWDTDDDPSSKTSTVTYWFAPGVPVPVRWMFEDQEKGLLFTYELKGWG